MRRVQQLLLELRPSGDPESTWHQAAQVRQVYDVPADKKSVEDACIGMGLGDLLLALIYVLLLSFETSSVMPLFLLYDLQSLIIQLALV